MPEQQQATRERPPATVVTGETHEAWIDSQLSPEPEKPEAKEPTAEEQAAQVKADAEAEEKAEKEALEKQDKGPLERRFHKLAEKRKEAENLAKQAAETARLEREEREKLAQELEALRQKYEPPKSDDEPEPKPEQFQNADGALRVDEYAQAVKKWTTDKALKDAAKERAEAEAKTRQEAVAKSWGERLAKAREELPDFDTKLQGSAVRVSDAIRDEILQSEVGPKILYYLADHAEEAKALTVRGVGRLEERLSKPPEKPKVEVSKAPEPIKPLSGAGPAPQTRDPNVQLPYQQYKAMRIAGKIG